MGTSHSVELLEDQDSVSEPGTKSILSASIADLTPPVSAKEVIEEFLSLVKYPVDPLTEAVLKSVDVTEEGVDCFTVKVVVDGQKLDSYGYGRGDGMDRVRTWKKVVVDRSARKVTTQDYVNEAELGAWADEAADTKVVCKTVLHVLEDPTRLEFCLDDEEGERCSGAGVRDVLYKWVDPIISSAQANLTAKVKIRCNAPSIKEAGLTSNVSGPMDEHVDYENFFGSMVALIRESLEKIPGCEITEVSDNEFVGTSKQQAPDGTEKVSVNKVRFSLETGDVVVEVLQGGKLSFQNFYTVHQSPIVAEMHGIDVNGKRVSGEAGARQMQILVNGAIEKANSWFG